MNTKSVSEIQANLPSILQELAPGEELCIVLEGKAVARLKRELAEQPQRRQAGTAANRPHHMAQDFDAPLDDFSEYME